MERTGTVPANSRLKLMKSTHKQGLGWPVAKPGDDPIATHVWPGEQGGAKGKVIWAGGMALVVR